MLMCSFLNIRANKVVVAVVVAVIVVAAVVVVFVVVVVVINWWSETKTNTLCGPRLSPIPCPGLFV